MVWLHSEGANLAPVPAYQGQEAKALGHRDQLRPAVLPEGQDGRQCITPSLFSPCSRPAFPQALGHCALLCIWGAEAAAEWCPRSLEFSVHMCVCMHVHVHKHQSTGTICKELSTRRAKFFIRNCPLSHISRAHPAACSSLAWMQTATWQSQLVWSGAAGPLLSQDAWLSLCPPLQSGRGLNVLGAD